LSTTMRASERRDGVESAPRIEGQTLVIDALLQRWRQGAGQARSHDPGLDRPGRHPYRPLTSRVRPASSRIVRTCAQYAAGVNYQRVTMSDLSAVTGVSERRVRDAFRDWLGMSPTAYLRVAALCEVRGALLGSPFTRDPVTRAAADFGFFHLSRFAAQYRELFGESPSETVAHARVREEVG